MIKVILVSLTLVLAHSVYAQPSDGTVGATGNQAVATTVGATDNYNDGCDHDKKYEHWKHEAEEHPDPDGQPNHEMMEHARHERHLARQSNLQAREFAKEALQALASRGQQTTAQAAQATMPDGSPINVALLQKIANLPVTGDSGDTTDTGSAGFHMNADNPTAQSAQSSADSNGVAAPQNAPVVYVGSQPGTITGGGGINGARSLAMPGSRFGSANTTLDANGNPLKRPPPDLKAQSTETIAADHIVTPADGQKDKKTLAANRALIMRQMGLRSPASVEEEGPYRAKTEDIFAVMHSHYKNMNDIGLFYDVGAVPPPSPGPSRNPPSFAPGW